MTDRPDAPGPLGATPPGSDPGVSTGPDDPSRPGVEGTSSAWAAQPEATPEPAAEPDPTPISDPVGGGPALAPDPAVQEANIDLLRGCGARVVFLEAPVELMMQRCQVGTEASSDNSRPLASDPDAFQALYARRLPQYRAADVTIVASNLTFDQQAQEIATRLNLPHVVQGGSD